MGLLLAGGLAPAVAPAQPTDAGSVAEELRLLRKEIEALREGQQKLLREVETLRSVRPGGPAPGAPAPPAVSAGQPRPELVVGVTGNPARGSPDAPVTLVEFSDYHCPFCARYFRETLPQLEREYVATGKVRYVFHDFPIASLHPEAPQAAEAANCAGEQGKYWEMHDRLFADQRSRLKALPRHVEALGLDAQTFKECLESARQAAEVKADVADGQKAGVSATPTFMLGRTPPDSGQMKVVKVIRGAQPYAVFKVALDELLAK